MKNNDKYEKLLQAYRDYQRGMISLDEYHSIEKELKENDFDLQLEEKLENEFKAFCEKLKEKTPEEIIEKAYELVCKEEIKEELKNMELHDQEKIIMIEQTDLLNEFYHDWLDTDIPLGDSLRSTLEESVASITRYFGKQNLFKIPKER